MLKFALFGRACVVPRHLLLARLLSKPIGLRYREISLSYRARSIHHFLRQAL